MRNESLCGSDTRNRSSYEERDLLHYDVIKEKNMEKLSKEEHMINDVLIKGRDRAVTENLDMKKLSVDSLGSSEQKYYDSLLRETEDEMRDMGIPDRNNPAKTDN